MGAELSRPWIETCLAAHRPRRYPLPGLRHAAVLVALFPDQDETRLWLLRRPDDGSAHGGQVGLPGGKPERADRDLHATALREANEEIGLPAERVQVLGELDELVTITRFRVTPVVGWVDSPFEPAPSPSEVDRLFSAPLRAFTAAPDRHEVKIAGFRTRVDSCRIDGEIVWGATYAILRKFVELLGR